MSYRFLASDASLTTSTSGDRSSAPSYTAKPQADEITLQGSFVSAMPMGEYEHAGGPLTLRLRGQIEGISKPVVFHKQRVTGAIIIRPEECTGATQISLKFEGNLSLDIDSGISQTHHTLNETHVLWQATESSVAIPSYIPFDIQLASEFVTKDGQRSPLPPTVEFSFPPPTSLRARATYAMTIIVDRRKKHGVLPRSKSLTVPFDYVRRTKPHLPMIVAPSTGLADSAQWFHQTSQVAFKSVSIQPLEAKLSVPAAKVYWIGHSIPFHLSIYGAPAVLRSLFPPSGEGVRVSVNIVRQVVARVRKMPGRREMVLGVGALRRSPGRSEDTVVRWEGQVQVAQPDTIPGFDAGALLVKDFIVAEITPPPTTFAPFDLAPHKIPIFIRFTTDRHEDDLA
ncbi:hypothetical protein K523DRAFT_271775 [Schizophyllum commune Tattone D]|nr:hypothetical protein K523DRAFT_271775 [Schizophyllum commune Tattone D]